MPFSCDTVTEPAIRTKLDRIQKHVKTLARPLICLPNIHPKEGLEAPPQFVATTKDTIVPQLTAPAMNCGMSIFATSLTKDDFSEEFLNAFARKLRSGVSERLTRWQTFLQWLGLFERKAYPYDLSRTELEDIFLSGAEAALKKYGLPETERQHMEYGGRVTSREESANINLADIIPRSSYTNGRHELGYNFGRNHFLEFQYVEKVVDEKTARAWGLSQNQIVLFYHGGGGHATYHLGRYFGRREKNTPSEKLALFWLKLVFHLSSWRGMRNFRARWHAYFSHVPFPATPLNSPEGTRLMQSIKIALNYGYAFRVALLARLRDALPTGTRVSFLWDAAHNSITEEPHDNEQLIVHRQDAMRVFPEKPVMVAGFNTLAYLGVGQETVQAFSSATPSAGKTIGTYTLGGTCIEDPSHQMLTSRRKAPELIRSAQFTPEGLFAVTHVLEQEGIVKPVAYLRPLATIKGH